MDGEGSGAQTSSAQDCVFHVGDDNYKLIIKLNKKLLAAKSIVFEKMFSGNFHEEDAVVIPDVHPEAFIITLKFLREEPYSFLTKELAVDVMQVAEKYQLTELKQKCEDFLLPKTVADVWWVAPHAYLYNSTVLLNAIRGLLSKHTSVFIFDVNFLEASEELVLDLVRLNSVTDVTELEIFKAVVEWGKHQLSKDGSASHDGKMLRQKLQKILEYVSLDVLDSSNQPTMPQFLKSKEVAEILEIHANEQSKADSEKNIAVTLRMGKEATPREQILSYTKCFATDKVQKCLVEVVANNSTDDRLCYRKKAWEESVALVKRAELICIIIPSQVVSGDTRCSQYWEDIQVSVTCSGYSVTNKKYGSGFFNGFVSYGQDIHVPITPVGYSLSSICEVSERYPLRYTFRVYFNCQGLHPWHSDRIFPANSLTEALKNTAGCVKGYRFMLPC